MIKSFYPEFISQRLAVKVKKKAENYIKQGHPWIFESSILKINRDGQAGDLAIVFDQKTNKYLGLGLFDPHSPIQIKMLAHIEQIKIDQTFFSNKIRDAFHRRAPLLKTDTNAYRLVFGENDGLPGFIADVYHNVVVIKIYSAIWFPYLHLLLNAILEVIDCEACVLRLSRILQKRKTDDFNLTDGAVIYGLLENSEIEFREHGVRFIANVIKGHKTGYFLDHRHNRHKIGKLSNGKSVLDIFSYAGGFSTHAIAGGARDVMSIDVSSHALSLAERNVRINVANPSFQTYCVDAFEGMQTLIDQGKYFDIVVVDPPSFAKMEADLSAAKKAYSRLASLAIELVDSGGLCVMASCSSRISADVFFELVENEFAHSNRSFRLLEKTFHDIDHPISFAEGAYLKTGYYHVD